jgi:hypothetical protein
MNREGFRVWCRDTLAVCAPSGSAATRAQIESLRAYDPALGRLMDDVDRARAAVIEYLKTRIEPRGPR